MRSARSTKMTSNSHLEQAKGGGWCTAATWAAAATVREHGGGAANLQEMASQIFVRAAWKRITGSGSAVGFASWALESTAAVGSAARRSRMIVPESRRESRLSAPQKGTVCVLTPQGIFKHRKRLQRGAACASGSGVEQPCRRKSGAPQLYQARQHVADCRSNEAQASSRGGVTCR